MLPVQGTGSRAKPFVLESDEPPVLLGEDNGANPVEFVLHALAGCLTTSLVYHAAARGISLESVESQFEGDLDLHGFLGLSDEVRNGYRALRVHFTIDSPASAADIGKVVAQSQARSAVLDVLTNGTAVEVSVSA